MRGGARPLAEIGVLKELCNEDSGHRRHDLLIVTVKCGNCEARTLIDSGATHNFASAEAMCFFSMFLVTFFSPNLRGRAGKKQNAQRKKKTLAQCPRLPDRQMTYQTYCVERSHSFVYFFTTQ